MIDRELLQILACPECKKPLSYDEARDSLKCAQCRRVFPIRDEIPVLLLDQATKDPA